MRNTVRDLSYINDPEIPVGNVARLVDNNGNDSVENTSNDPFRSFPGDEVEQGIDDDRQTLREVRFSPEPNRWNSSEASLLAWNAKQVQVPRLPTRNLTGHIDVEAYAETSAELLARSNQIADDVLSMRLSITPDELRGGVGTSCRYRITVEISSQNQQHPWWFRWSLTVFLSECEISCNGLKPVHRNDHISLQTFELPGVCQKRTGYS